MGINEIIKVGNNIKDLRKKKGLTQKDMASLLNIPSSTYSNYENNNREPGKKILLNISEILGVSIYDLLNSNRNDISLESKDIVVPEECDISKELTTIERLIQLCGFNINFNELNEHDSILNEYLKSEIKNNLIPLAYINKGEMNINLTNDQFKDLSDKILQLVTFEVNELIDRF